MVGAGVAEFDGSFGSLMLDLGNLPAGFHDDPYPVYTALRETAPVCVQPNGSVILSRYADLQTAYRDTARFISDKKAIFGPKYGAETPLYEHHTTSLVFNDPPLHTRVRKIMVGALNPRALQRLRPGLEDLVDELLDDLEENPSPDLIEHFASAIPVEVIGNLFDIPHEQRAPLRDWSLAILGALEPVLTPEQHEVGNRAVTDFVALLRDVAKDRRKNPGDPETDVLTRLIAGDSEGRLSEVELYQNCIFILNAGHETTTNLIGNGLDLLNRHRDARTEVIANPALVGPAVEEVLRMESSNQFGNRLTTEDIKLHGHLIPAGTDLHLCIGAANRDAEVFKDPESFQSGRQPNKHLAFGSGAHTCVGLTLARMEGQVALSRFLERFPNYQMTEGAVRSNRIRFRGFTSLPVALS